MSSHESWARQINTSYILDNLLRDIGAVDDGFVSNINKMYGFVYALVKFKK